MSLSLRSHFPVLERLAYLNAGTDGPLPAAAVEAAAAELRREARDGRARAQFERRTELGTRLRASYAAALGCEPADVALTTCTSEGIAQVIGGLDLGSDDEILTSDEEHPGLLGALGAARAVRGVRVRMVPLPEIAGAIDPRATRLIACSHVGWMSGLVAPADLAAAAAEAGAATMGTGTRTSRAGAKAAGAQSGTAGTGAAEAAGSKIPILLDGAQGVGAIPVDVHALGCDAYAGAGQKWLCGPDGTGMLYVSPSLRARLRIERRGYSNLADPGAGLDAAPHGDARALDTMALSAEALACALAAVAVLEDAGLEMVFARARTLATHLAELLAEHGRAVAPRGPTTLVSFASPDPESERDLLLDSGIVLRNIPGRPWLRASVGAWNDEDDLDRLLVALSAR